MSFILGIIKASSSCNSTYCFCSKFVLFESYCLFRLLILHSLNFSYFIKSINYFIQYYNVSMRLMRYGKAADHRIANLVFLYF